MFDWLKRLTGQGSAPAPKAPQLTAEPAATPAPSDPSAALPDAQSELRQALARRDVPVDTRDGWLVDTEFDMAIRAELLEVASAAQGTRVAIGVEIRHPVFGETTVREYVHSAGDTVLDAMVSGLDRWAQADYVVLEDVFREQAESCLAMVMDGAATAERPAFRRRILMGPVQHFVRRDPDAAPQCAIDGEEHSPFCPCCLFTSGHEAFFPVVSAPGFYAIRLFAARHEDGEISADCRINGEDFEPGAEALRRYVATWPGEGFTFRKQYVVAHDAAHLPPPDRGGV
ncbi:DUF6348 family protein [Tahibacter amnicola]|uniref:DUF6348 family protein n=1 Tax=Tahibacter amnicola TaxID=2976241 RepID=A0ABY6BHV3_9GAMM|nr:DUF6348 family protein [Tahibacter amnicola]UXI68923.1 DUF6348 family protein [Tahibacter amnicola]